MSREEHPSPNGLGGPCAPRCRRRRRPPGWPTPRRLPMGGHALRQRDHRPDGARALDLDLTAEQLPAGVLGCDPRSPRVPAARGEETELQAEAAGLIYGVRNAGHRFRAEEGGPGRDDLVRVAEAAHVPDDGPAEPLGLQLLKLAGQLIPVNVTVEPRPEDARPGRKRRIEKEPFGERLPVRARPGSGRSPWPASPEDQEGCREERGMDPARRLAGHATGPHSEPRAFPDDPVLSN